MNELIKWGNSLINSLGILYIEGIHDDYEGLKVLISNESKSKHFKIKFEDFYGYRNFNESERLKTINRYSESICKSSLYKTQGSKFINWLSEESLGVIEIEKIWHYLIITPEDIFEVLALEPPTIEEIFK